MEIEKIRTTNAPAPSGSYSQAIRAGDFLFLSGQGPFAPDGTLVNDTFEAQVRQVFANLMTIAVEAGTSLDRAVRMGVYLHDLSSFDEMDAIYRKMFTSPLPARTTIETPLPGFDIEVDAIVAL